MYKALICPHINYDILLLWQEAHEGFNLQKKHAMRSISLSKCNFDLSKITIPETR